MCEGLETAAGALGRQTGSPGLQASVLPPQSLRSGGREKHAHPGSLGGWVGALLLNSVSEATSHGFWGGGLNKLADSVEHPYQFFEGRLIIPIKI